MKDRFEEIAREFSHAWKTGGRQHVLEQLAGDAATPEIAPAEIAAVTALMMTHLPTWLDQVEFRDELLDLARSRCQTTSARRYPR